MPEFIGRLIEWFQARSTAQKALIVIGALVVLVVASPLTILIAAAVLLISLVVLGLRMVRSGSLRGPAIVAAAALIAVGVFSGISAALYGGDQPQETTEVQEAAEDPVADPEPEDLLPDPEPEEQQEPEAVADPEQIEVPESVDYRVVFVREIGEDEQGFSARTWLVDSEDNSLGALCAIAQDAALDAGEGWDVVRVVADAGIASVRMSDVAPDYSEQERFVECPVPEEIFITR